MRIAQIRTSSLGPLPALDWSLADCEVVYDDNQQGKTTLVDVLIHYLFKEGNKRLFEGEGRYADYPEATIAVEQQGETHQFGSENPSARFSELLGWNMPELHRLLCVRAGEIAIHGGGRKRDEMWQLLSGLLSGLEADRVERVKKLIQNEASVTGTFQWSNQGNQKVRDRYVQELVPQIERAQDAEEIVHRLLRLNQEKQETESAKADLEAKQRTLQERRQGLEILQRRRRLERAKGLIDQALPLRRRIADEFGFRITTEFETEWNSVNQEVAKARTNLEQCESLSEEIQELDGKLQELNNQLNEAHEERERHRAQWRDWRENRLRPLVQQLERRRDAFHTAKRSSRLGIGLGAVGVGLVVAGLLLEGFSPWVGIVPGALLLGTGAGLIARVPQTRRSFEKVAQQLADLLSEGLNASIAVAHALERARELLNSDVGELMYPDGEDPVTQLQTSINELKTKHDVKQGQLDAMLPDGEPEQDPTEFWQRRVGDLEEREEELRQKTGCPDFETLQSRLAERREMESELSRLRIRLSQALDLSDEDLDLDTEATKVERRMAELEVPDDLSAIDDPDAELAALDREESEIQGELKRLNQELEGLQNERHGIHRTFAELGVGIDEPEKLFETRRQWKAELADGIRDRLAAALACGLLDRVQRDYQTQIKRLLEDGDLNRLYREAMGEDQDVRFNEETLTFEVAHNGQVIGEHALSSGALTHLYFACRLSLLGRLFGETPGFMILDDPFLTYAPERKRRAIGLLESFLEEGWQVIVFTVDPATCDGFRELGGTVRRIRDLGV